MRFLPSSRRFFRSSSSSVNFDYTPGEQNIRKGPADYTGRLCVIGSKLVDEKLASLFGVA